MAPFPIGTFVETFLDREKKHARRLIRREMKSMLDPLVESLFGQLKAKFVDYLDAALGFHRELSHDSEDDEQMINRNLANIVNAQKYHLQSLDNSNHSTDDNSQLNSTNHHESKLIKEEIKDPSNVQLESQQNDDSNNSSSSTRESFPQPMNPSTSTDESSNSEMQKQQSHIKDNVNEYDDGDDDEEECDCDECVYGMIGEEEEDDDDDDDDDAQLIDEHDHKSSPPVKRPRMDPTQSQVIGSQGPSERTNQDQQNQVQNHDKPLVVILAIECTELCRSIFVKNHDYPLVDQLKDHMWNEHSIRQSRCLVKDCTESFDNRKSLRSHINQAHPNTSQWHCDKCPEYFTSYKLLTSHKKEVHQHGLFQCSYPYCIFSGENRKKIYDHYTETHKPDLECDQCDYRTKDSTLFKAHERAHLGPYRCKWPDCQYSNTSRNTAMMHIKNVHFITKTSQELTYLGVPKDFLEVVQ